MSKKYSDNIFVKKEDMTKDGGSFFEELGMTSDELKTLGAHFVKECVFGSAPTKTEALKAVMDESEDFEKIVKKHGIIKACFLMGFATSIGIDKAQELTKSISRFLDVAEEEEEEETSLYLGEKEKLES